MKNILSCFVNSVLLAVVIIGMGYLFAYVFLNDPHKLGLSLFVLGGITMLLFIPSRLLGHPRGVLLTPKITYCEFRKVDNLEQKEENETENTFPAIIYVIAGALTWIFSLVIY